MAAGVTGRPLGDPGRRKHHRELRSLERQLAEAITEIVNEFELELSLV